MYKNRGVVLTSIQDHWKGRKGYQQWPWVATVGKEAVFTRSGTPAPSSTTSNTTLPYVEQVDNVALIMYRADKDLSLFTSDSYDVALHWQEEDFDEVVRFDNWIVARQGTSYVAVRKHCNQTINGYDACDDQDGQTWAVVVGNSSTHGSFDDFEEVIRDSSYAERWIYNWLNGGYTYHGEINVDGKRIYHRWAQGVFYKEDLEETALVKELVEGDLEGVTLYPSPANTYFNITTNADFGTVNKITAVNYLGQLIYKDTFEQENDTIRIACDNWEPGVYFLVLESDKGTKTLKLIKE